MVPREARQFATIRVAMSVHDAVHAHSCSTATPLTLRASPRADGRPVLSQAIMPSLHTVINPISVMLGGPVRETKPILVRRRRAVDVGKERFGTSRIASAGSMT